MAFTEPNAMERLKYMQDAKTVAIVGASDNPSRASYFVATYLLSAAHFKLFFVNPKLDEILGQKVYKSLADIPEPVDIVDVFRKTEDVLPIAKEAFEIGATCFWQQLGVENHEADMLFRNNGRQSVTRRCVKIEHARIFGGLNWVGVNTGIISAKRPV